MRLRILMSVAAMVAAGLALIGGVAGAAPDTDTAAIHEFRTAADQGWFYTLNSGEAARAADQNRFRPTATFGRLHTRPAPGTQPIHRLRLKSAQSYMLSVSPAEFRNPAFVDEGVFGFIDTAPHPGERQLLRFSRNGQWRVLSDDPANVRTMRAQGFAVDGPLGYHQP